MYGRIAFYKISQVILAKSLRRKVYDKNHFYFIF